MYKSASIVLIFLAITTAVCVAADKPQTYNFDDESMYDKTNLYKGWPNDWWATWYIKEFDLITKEPGGVDWIYVKAESGKLWLLPDPNDWVKEAANKGWATNNDPLQPKVGALAIKYIRFRNTCFIYIVREINGNKMVIETLVQSKEGTRTMKVQIPIERMNQSIIMDEFTGYIYPYKNITKHNKKNA